MVCVDRVVLRAISLHSSTTMAERLPHRGTQRVVAPGTPLQQRRWPRQLDSFSPRQKTTSSSWTSDLGRGREEGHLRHSGQGCTDRGLAVLPDNDGSGTPSRWRVGLLWIPPMKPHVAAHLRPRQSALVPLSTRPCPPSGTAFSLL